MTQANDILFLLILATASGEPTGPWSWQQRDGEGLWTETSSLQLENARREPDVGSARLPATHMVTRDDS